MKERVGLIGLGIMGKPMARNLLRVGFPLTVHNRSRGPVEELAKEGAEAGDSPMDVAKKSDVTITMLPNSPDVEQVVLGENGLLHGAKSASVVVDMSTISPTTTKRIASRLGEKGVEMLDAPVSGGEKGAIEGTLSIMVGGKESVFQRCLPIFQALGKNIVHVGQNSAGQLVKACNQIIAALTYAAIAEAFVLGAKAGVKPEPMLKALLGGAARCWALEVRTPKVLKRDFEPGFKASLHYKDLGIVLETAKDLGVPLPLTAHVHELYKTLLNLGRGDYDSSGIITVLEDLADVKVQMGD